MKKILGLILIVFAMFLQVAFAGTPEVFKLQNGHTVIIQEVPSSKLVCVDTWVKTGSINENKVNSGVAHFLEHLFFKGTTKRHAGEFEKILDGKGAIYNAATSKDFTHYYITIKKDDLALAMDLQSDMLLNPAIPEAELNRERKVVLEEISRSNDSPSNVVFQNLNKMLYKSHPYKRRVLGDEAVVANISRDKIFEFYNTWYHPSNMITVIVGNVDKNEALSLVKKHFVQKKKKFFCKKKYRKEPTLRAKLKKIAKGHYNTGYMEIGFKGVPSSEVKDSYALDVLSSILGDGRSSRLYRILKEEKNLVNDVSVGHYSLKEDSVFYVSASFNPKNSMQIEKEILAQINKVKTNGVTQKELQRAKNVFERAFVYANESVGDIANMIGYNMVVGGDIGYYSDYISNIKKVSAEDVLRVARKYLGVDKMAISILLPEKMPEQKALKPVACKNCDKISKQILPNGMTLITENTDANDVVAMEILIKGGKFVENKAGVADVLTKVLLRGTKDRTVQDLSEEIENYGIVLSPSLVSDYFQISLKSTKADFPRAFKILKDIMNNSLIASEDVDKAKKDILDGIKQVEDSSSSVAINKFKEKIYQNAYGRSFYKVKKSIPNVSRDDVVNYYTKYFAPQNMIVSVCGDISDFDIENKLKYFIRRNGVKVDTNKFLTKFTPLKKNIKVITKKKTQTAWVVMGQRVSGIQNEKDYVALKVINSILGQGMSSRLFIDLRERKGLAYEIASAYPNALDNIYFVLYIGTNPKNVELVQQEFKKELKRLMQEKVAQDELNRAKQRIIGYLALGQETNSEKAFLRARNELYKKGYDFAVKYEKLVHSVSAGDIMKTANKYFNKPYVISIVEPIE